MRSEFQSHRFWKRYANIHAVDEEDSKPGPGVELTVKEEQAIESEEA
jgi:hypothetical protein